jgi:hypothetical protein
VWIRRRGERPSSDTFAAREQMLFADHYFKAEWQQLPQLKVAFLSQQRHPLPAGQTNANDS